jgi:glycosyltransferase involved in cell wall biosynthesis
VTADKFPSTTSALNDTLQRALACQLSGQLAEARDHYEKALRMHPDHFDALHMLGVTLYQLGQPEEGGRLILRAIRLIGDQEHQAILTNLGLCLSKLARSRGLAGARPHDFAPGHCHPLFFRRNNLPRMPDNPPGISIIIPSYNHAHYIDRALESVFTQNYPNIELIVIDDGSRDDSVARITGLLERCPFPHNFVARNNVGAHATINEGIELSSNPWVTILNSDDWYAPQRIERMIRAAVSQGTEWAFSGISIVDDDSRPISLGMHARADTLIKSLEQRYLIPSLSAGFVDFNLAITTGNLVFTRDLWKRLGGFEGYRYNHDWDFCLKATLECEPAYIDEPLYFYRLHQTNTISESVTKAQREVLDIFKNWFQQVTADGRPRNPEISRISPGQWALIRDEQLLSSAMGHQIGKSQLLQYASMLGLH